MSPPARSSSSAPGSPARAAPRRCAPRATTASSCSSARSRSRRTSARRSRRSSSPDERSADDLLLRPDVVLGRAADRARPRGAGRLASTGSGRPRRPSRGRGSAGRRSSSPPARGRGGSRSRRPTGVHVLRTLADATALREELVPGARLAIVGGGFVGAEVASTARVARRRRDPARGGTGSVRAGARAGARRQARGAVPRPRGRHPHGDGCGRVPARRPTDVSRRVVLADGSVVECDVVLVAVGVEPAHELGRETCSRPSTPAATTRAAAGHWTGAAAEAVDVGPAPARARSAAAAAAVLLVRPVRPAAAARRRHDGTRTTVEVEGSRRLLRRALPGCAAGGSSLHWPRTGPRRSGGLRLEVATAA